MHPPGREAAAAATEPAAPPGSAEEEETAVAAAAFVTFEARCVDGLGVPIQKATVQLVRALDGRPEYHTSETRARLVTTAVTDLNGLIRMESVEPGTYVLGRVPKENETTAWLRPVDVSAHSPDIPPDIPLVDTEWLVGVIEGKKRSRANAAGLPLSAFQTGLAMVPVATVQADGSFRIGPLVPGSYHLSSVTTEDVELAIRPKVAQSAPLDQATANPIRLASVDSHAFVGRIDTKELARSGQAIGSRRGLLRIGMHSSSSPGNVRWAAACRVQPEGTFQACGLPSGNYYAAYTSDDGTLIAKGRIHTTRRRTLRLDREMDARNLAQAVRRCDGEIEAEPAAIAWIYPGRYASRGPLAVEVQRGARDVTSYPLSLIHISEPTRPY